jgi:tRNA synthetases class I (E and Q), catalytic domain
MTVRVRFAPSPTGSLHVGNALDAVANRAYANEHGGRLVLRIDDTDATRVVPGGERAVLLDLEWLGVRWDEGPIRQSERARLYAAAAERLLETGAAIREADGTVRLTELPRPTLLREDGSATYQLATVVDDLDLAITQVIRGSDHRSNLAVQQSIARALGAELPEVIHHGLVLGDDGKKLSKRHGHASVADLREEGLPGVAVRAYLDELGLPTHDVRSDLRRVRRLAIDAIAAMPDDELAALAGAPVEAVPALRGARTLVEAREMTRQILERPTGVIDASAVPTLDRFVELRQAGGDRLEPEGAKEIVRELKAIGGDLRSLRQALTGAEHGPELSAVVVALSRDEAIRRARAAH